MRVKALDTLAVETAGGEVVPTWATRNEARFRHANPSRPRHRRIGLFYLGRIPRVVRAAELDQVVVVAACLRFQAVNGITLFVHGHQGLWTRAARGAPDTSEFGKAFELLQRAQGYAGASGKSLLGQIAGQPPRPQPLRQIGRYVRRRYDCVTAYMPIAIN